MAYNCLDRHIEAGRGDDPALLWEGNEPGEDARYSFSQLRDLVCQIANYLRSVGVGKGDRVARASPRAAEPTLTHFVLFPELERAECRRLQVIYLPMRAELPAAMLACARIGAIHSVVFGGFSAEARKPAKKKTAQPGAQTGAAAAEQPPGAPPHPRRWRSASWTASPRRRSPSRR